MHYTVHGILQARILEWVAFPFSRGSSQSRDQTQVSCLQADSLPSEPPGKPKNTGVNSLSPLQRIFLNQELNRGLLHCRKIFYQIRLATREAQVWAIIVKLTWFYKRVVIFVGSSENLKQMTDFIFESALTHPSTCEFLLFQFHDLTLSSQNPISRYWDD